MKGADILVIIITVVIMLSIIFFSFVMPFIRNKGQSNHCSSCPVGKDKKIKRAFKDYKKSKK